MINLLPHQKKAIEETNKFNHVAYYLDMGLGKTFVGSEKAIKFNSKIILTVCQKSKLNDWLNHFIKHYAEGQQNCVYDLSDGRQLKSYLINIQSNKLKDFRHIGIINYDLVWRRKELLQLENFTLMLDESSCIKNEKSNRTKFILKMKPTNVILLSGTPTGGKYEELYSQCKLLGWKISKKAFWDTYIITKDLKINGFKIPIVVGYKNIDRLKQKLRDYGAVFMKTEEVLDLPEQIHNVIKIECSKEYKKFKKDRYIKLDDKELIGDTSLTKLLYLRQLASQYNNNKLSALEDLLESSNDRLVIFYNFNEELDQIKSLCKKLDRPISIVNGANKDLKNYEAEDNSITLIQYQAGAMGLNLQKANKIIYYSLTLSSELFEQSKKRIHRIGQKNNCMYYYLITAKSIEEKIYEVLGTRRDFTNKLFEECEE